MSFDAHSLERLKELGRSLPKALPTPVKNSDIPSQSAAGTKASERRHRVETEEDPDALFRELMQVSPDGTVPPHLLERLKKAEGQRATAVAPPQAALPNKAASGKSPTNTGKPKRAPGMGDAELYTVFQQLLLEDDDLGESS
ncbi:hypothetical protein [Cyanobium sp. WAJ14-Wanaka]|uniref:hypothetical protein n=1 Tax=Cyanobium sp. WAJ14-Wanaka TaxID=2823725 RepID=UPI0020CC2FAB|nr:hypothetical protein [Cyanobium sp. WAJ14-Wanaka]MCP9774632.1 hypothetical protein [Cyanobium sp. WAJ14-Wanaka]